MLDGPSAERSETTPVRPKARTEPRRMEKGNTAIDIGQGYDRQRYAKVRKGTQRYAKVRKGTQRYAKVRKGTQRYAKVRKGTQRYAKVRKGTQRYAKVRKGTQRYAVRGALLAACCVSVVHGGSLGKYGSLISTVGRRG